MEILQTIIQFILFLVLVSIVSKRYATLFLLFFVDAYFFNLWSRIFNQVYKLTDISYVSQSLAQPFIKMYELFTDQQVTLTESQNLILFIIVWGIIILFAVIEHGIDNHYLKRYRVKANIKEMRLHSQNSKIRLDFVNSLTRNYQFIYLDSIYYLHIFSYQFHLNKNQCIHQRIKINTIQNMELKKEKNGYHLLIYTDYQQILDGGFYHEKNYEALLELKEAITREKENLKNQSTIVFGKEKEDVTKL